MPNDAPSAATGSVRAAILEQFEQVAKQQRKTLKPLTDDLPLLDSGLDSLCIAVIVAVLDDQLGVDPFSGDMDAPFPKTIGQFISIYENAAA
jgi:acyl carrier protein